MPARRTLLWSLVCAAFFLAAASASAQGGFRRYLRLSADVRSLEAHNRDLAAENARLLREVKELKEDGAALERVVREDLGYVKAGEVVFSFDGAPRGPR